MQKVVNLLRFLQSIERKIPRFIFFCTLFTIGLLLLSAQSHGQDLTARKVTLNIKDASIKEALMSVQKQSGIMFAYGQDIDKYKDVKLSISEKDITVRKAIELILKNTNLGFKQENAHVMINENTSVKSPNVSTGGGPGTLKGRIVEFETSQPLPSASIYLVELQKGMEADNAGYYKFTNIPAGKYTLKVSYISFTTEKIAVEIKVGKEETYDVKMRGSGVLNEVVVSGTAKRRVPVAHASDKQVLSEIKSSQSIVSGISSQQISMSADRNAAEVVQKISGVSIKDDKFIIIRGMNERYNLTYLNGNVAPSTELYSRAFSLDLIPSRIIDKIMVFKSPAPDLMADMTGGAIKIFTKDASNVKHFDIELQLGYRPNTTFNSKFLTYQGSGTDFLGFDNGLRKLPSVVPGYGDFTKAQISQKAYAENFSPYLQYGHKTALPMMQLTANYYNSFKIGSKSISMLSALSYKAERQQYDVDRANSFYGGNLDRTHVITKETQSTETVQLNLLQNFTYKLRDSSTLTFKNYLLQQGQNATVVRTSKNDQYLVGNFDTDLSHLSGLIWRDRSPGYDLYERNIILGYTQRFLYTGNLSGNHYLGKGKQQLEWNAGYIYSRQQIPDQRVIRLQQNRQDGARVTLPGPPELNWTSARRFVPGPDDAENRDNNLERGMVSRTWSKNIENVYNGSVDYTYKIKPWVTFKVGTYQQWKTRTLFRRVYTLNEGDLNSVGYPDDPIIGGNGRFMDFSKVFFLEQDLGKVWSNDYLKDDGSALKVFDRTSGSDAYTASEQLNAGYAALSLLPFNGKLDIYGGLRVEYNRQKVAGAIPGYYPGAVNSPVAVDNKTTNYLPSVNVSYRPAEQLVMRAAYGKTVNRPEFRELSPYSELDYLNNQTISGNNLLKPANASNYDARIEWYPKNNINSETFSIGAFYKELTNPIERTIYRSLFFGGPATISFTNADKATVKGLEFDIRKNLGFIPVGFFRNLSVIGNLTLISSKVTKSLDTTGVNKNTDAGLNPHYTRQLQGQASYSSNVGLYYDNASSGTKVALNWNIIGPRIYAAANGMAFKTERSPQGVPIIHQGEQGSLIELKRQTLDFALTQRIVKSLQFKFSVQNLLNQPIRVAEDENFTFKYEKAQYAGKDGVDINGDIISSEYKADRHFIFSFMYSF